MHHNTKIIAGMSGILLLAALSAFAGFTYIVSKKKGELEVQLQAAAAAKAHERELSSLVRVVKETQDEREELNTYMLTEGEIIGFLSLIETVAKEQGVELKTSQLTEQEASVTFERLNIRTLVSGPYAAVARTLAIFEELPYQSSLPNVALTKRDDEQGGDSWSGEVEIVVTKFKKI